jgi:L-ascorbate metabolism protein UlaG (beta-lactamase superfamily)
VSDPPVVRVTLVGGPTVLIEYGGLRILTDPTFSEPGEYAGGLTKLTGPAVPASDLGPIDVALISHDHHADNLDPAGHELLAGIPHVFTTKAGAERLGNGAIGLEPDENVSVGGVDIAALPALHGPPGSEKVTGPVIGFWLTGEEGMPIVYVSGDNASLEVVAKIAKRLPVDLAILFAGAVSLPHRFDGAYLTLSSDAAAQAALLLDAFDVIPVHYEGWAHFTEGADELRAAFDAHDATGLLRLLAPGEHFELF